MSNAVPTEIAFENLQNVIQGWYSADAHQEAKSNSDVAVRLDLSTGTISRQNKFLLELGILEKAGHNKKLTKRGEEYAEALYYEKPNPEHYVSELVFEYEPTSQIVDYVRIAKPDRESIIEKLYDITDNDTDSNASIDTLFELYLRCGIIIAEDDQYSALLKEEIELSDTDSAISESETHKEQPKYESQSANEGRGVSNAGNDLHSDPQVTTSTGNVQVSLDIDLQITGDDNPDNVQNIVFGIRRALEADIDGSESESFELEDPKESQPNQIEEESQPDLTSFPSTTPDTIQ